MMNLASAISLKNGPVANERRAKSGSATAAYGRRMKGGVKMERRAIAATGTKFDPPGHSVPDFVQPPANDDFSAVVLDLRLNQNLSRKAIGKMAGVGSETVKAWERGRQMAQFEHIRRLARSVRSVRLWTLRQLGADEMPEFMTPRLATAMMAALHQVAHQPGPDGDAVRAVLQGVGAPK